tara:strand:- start:203 stop:613 length:411 start_codon:yes stop_codon:yes gene_type:complete
MGPVIKTFLAATGGFAIGKEITKAAEGAYSDLKDYTTLDQTSRYKGTPGMYGEGLRYMGVNWAGKKWPGFHKWMVKTERKGWEYEPHETDIKTEDNHPLVTDYHLSKNGLVQWIQKNFTDKGKAAVQDIKLKSVKK